jgi:hypothetical protein
MSPLAEKCELTFRQVSKYSGRSDGCSPESSNGSNWPIAASLKLNTGVHFPIVNDKPAGLHFQHGIPDAFLRPPAQVAGRQALSAA